MMLIENELEKVRNSLKEEQALAAYHKQQSEQRIQSEVKIYFQILLICLSGHQFNTESEFNIRAIPEITEWAGREALKSFNYMYDPWPNRALLLWKDIDLLDGSLVY